eukprot:3934210-Rhodomonas_salina.2
MDEMDGMFLGEGMRCRAYVGSEEQARAEREHYGQTKLFLSEMQFLMLHCKPGDVVVYAGSACG